SCSSGGNPLGTRSTAWPLLSRYVFNRKCSSLPPLLVKIACTVAVSTVISRGDCSATSACGAGAAGAGAGAEAATSGAVASILLPSAAGACVCCVAAAAGLLCCGGGGAKYAWYM